MRLGLVSLMIGVLHGCAFKSEKIEKVDDYLDSLYHVDGFEGTMVIGNRDGIIYQKEQGLANREWSISHSLDTRFDIASLNKSFVGYMIMQLVESGSLKLSDKIN
ncbi:MAG: serine hydrolase, partial [Ekhidna sp.]|nr:serine hydrolase [Ekhidna sp.]